MYFVVAAVALLFLVNALVVVLRFGQLRRRLKDVDPEFHDAVYQWAYWPIPNPPEAVPFRQFIWQRQYDQHFDDQVRYRGDQLRSGIVRWFVLFALIPATAILAKLI